MQEMELKNSFMLNDFEKLKYCRMKRRLKSMSALLENRLTSNVAEIAVSNCSRI